MIELLAVAGYLVLFVVVAWASDRWSPLVGIGGVMVVLSVAHWLV